MNTPRPPERAPCVNLAEHAERAQAVLPPDVWAYLQGGAADELTLRANSAAWQALHLAPRVLQPLADGHTRCTLLGTEYPHPILVAPMAYQRLFHPQGERLLALAASAQQAGLVVSGQTSTPLHTVAQSYQENNETSGESGNAAGSTTGVGPLWMQLTLSGDRAATLDLIAQAEAAGYQALVLTVDAPVHGARDRERSAQFRLPPDVRAVHLPRAQAQATPTAGLCGGLVNTAPTWSDVAWLLTATRLPLLLKGITHPADARQARSLGVHGLIVSNHGGRTLDTIRPTATLLPRIADALQGDLTLLADGGIRRGTDVLKAIALGANAVLVGRPCLHGLAHAGALGVAQVLRLLRDELEIAMALCGCRTLQDIGPALLEHP